MISTLRSNVWLFTLIVLLTFTFILPFAEVQALEQHNTLTLNILHTNDIHSNIIDFGKIAAYLQSERDSAEYSLYLDAGDIFSGHPVVDLRGGWPMVDLLNHLGLQAMAIGNHEFDYGQTFFGKNVMDSNFPWLSANMHVIDPNILIPQPEPYTVFEFDELTVGVVALTEAPPSTAPSGVEGLHFDEDYAEVVEQYRFLRDEVDVLIALTHIGYPEDRQLAQAVDWFDLIIGGHSHTVLTQPVVVNGTPIAQAGANGAYVGNIRLTLDRTTKEVQQVSGFLQNVNELVEVDPVIQEKVDQYIADLDDVLGQVIGYSNTGLTRDGRTTRDVPLGNFWTDAMREMVQTDIALTNNGGIRDSIAPGEITAGDIYRVEPFANEIMELRMTGQAIKDVIEYSYSRRNQIDLQTSGLHYEVIVDPAGNYLDARLSVHGEPIDLERQYTVAVADYIGTGGSGYTFEGEVLQPSAGLMTTAMIEYAKKLMEEVGAIDYQSEDRIKITVDSSGGVPGEVIGHTQHGLFSEDKTERDVGLGNLYTDAVRAQTNADLALINNSSVLGSIPPGEITVEQIISLDRYQNEIVLVRTTGQRIRDMILSQSNYYRGVDVQASGMTYTLREGEGSARFADVEIILENGEPLNLTDTYTVAYNDYMHGRSFYNLGNDVIDGDFGRVYEATIEYVRHQTESIDYVEGQRIQIQ